jgi:deoxyribose-phosphate aldolase
MAAELGVASVCVKPSMVALAAQLLAGCHAVPSTVIGFPHGGTSTAAKVRETEVAREDGAREVDMVVNLGRVLAEDWEFVAQDIRAVVQAAGEALTKVIFETGLLPSDALKIELCKISEQAGAAFVKTSTGFGMVKDSAGQLVATGATEHDVRLLRKHCSEQVAVKASGGIRSFADAQRMVALGATRLGTSGTLAIAAGEQGRSETAEGSY